LNPRRVRAKGRESIRLPDEQTSYSRHKNIFLEYLPAFSSVANTELESPENNTYTCPFA
jgi:hypothetical protein